MPEVLKHEPVPPQDSPEEAARRAAIIGKTVGTLAIAEAHQNEQANLNFWEGSEQHHRIARAGQDPGTADSVNGRKVADNLVDAAILGDRAKEVAASIKQTPMEMIDKPGVEHDPYRARHVASEIDPEMTKAAMARLKINRDRHLKKAAARAKKAEARYDQDPLNPRPVYRPPSRKQRTKEFIVDNLL